ncbi:MAG: MOSC domain-containing protein [Candidatus Hydrogenedentes bacterium]|nr:MOSC domain-containing protein [Candidatus Hydrogenedentota bacterium]
MEVVSVNTGRPRGVPYRGETVQTGIFKEAVQRPVHVGARSIEGDVQVDLRYHGGIDKAVYGYPSEHYAHWATVQGVDAFPWGQFGENLSTRGLLESSVHIGDIYQIGAAHLQVTQPRVPCFKLGIKMGSAAFVKKFLDSQFSGFYFRVVEEGAVQAGDTIELLERDPRSMSLIDIHTLHFKDTKNRTGLERAVAITGLSDVWREELQELLEKLKP